MATTWGVLEQRGRVLAEEASASVGAGRILDPAWLDSAACWLSEGAGSWSELTGYRPQRRAYRQIVSSLHFEAWLICWPCGGRLALHDHGGASGALQVLDGTLTEAYVLDRQLPARRRALGPGTGINFEGSYIHDVSNARAELATSIHVYSSAERAMRHYRLTGAGLVEALGVTDDALVVSGTDEVPAAPASTVVGRTDGPGPRSLHPAGSSRQAAGSAG